MLITRISNQRKADFWTILLMNDLQSRQGGFKVLNSGAAAAPTDTNGIGCLMRWLLSGGVKSQVYCRRYLDGFGVERQGVFG